MKKYRLMAAMLALFLLTACGQSRPAGTAEQKAETPPAVSENTETPPPPAPETAEKPVVQAAASLPDRPETATQEFTVEGLPETVPVTLYAGEGWSVYIPDEGWRLDDRERDDGVFQTVWESTVNDDAELWVLELGQRTLAEGQDWLRREENDFALQEDKQGGLFGTDREDRELMEVRFHEGGGNLYAVVWTYPETAAEGFGTRLGVMADSFQITQ